MGTEVRAFRKILPQQSVGVLVRTALPWAARVAEVDRKARVDPQAGVLRHLRSLIPRQRPAQLLRQGRDLACNRVAHRLGTVPGQRRAVLLARPVAVARHRRQVQQHREPRRALDEGAGGGAAKAQDEIPLPMAWHRTAPRLCRALADQNLRSDERLAPPARARPRYAQCPARPQARGQFTLQGAPTLDVERLVDGLVADAHGAVARKVEPQAFGNLLRAPCHSPSPVLPSPMPSTFPRHRRAGHRRPARCGHGTDQSVLDIRLQCRIGGQLHRLRSSRCPLRVPLCDCRPVIQIAAPRRRVTPQFPRHR